MLHALAQFRASALTASYVDRSLFSASQPLYRGRQLGGSRILGSDFMSKLAAVKFKTGEACPHFMAAVLKVQFNFPKESDGVCRTLASGDVSNIFRDKNNNMIQACEKAMMQARAVVERLHDASDEGKLYELGMYDCRLVLFIASKLKENGQKEYTTIDSIGKDRTCV